MGRPDTEIWGRGGYEPEPENDLVSEELKDAPRISVQNKQKAMSLSETRVFAWLRLYTPQIAAAEKQFNVDRRAIAGAIAWEALENISTHHLFSRWSGPGKIHYKRGFWEKNKPTVAQETEDAGYLAKQKSDDERGKYLEDPTHSIFYIAAIMRGGADAAEENGYIVSNRPDILTDFYQAHNLGPWRAHLAAKRGTPLVAGNDMAHWVSAHLGFLEDAVGTPEVKLMSIDVRSPPPTSRQITVEQGDTLSDLASKHYGSQEYWPLIWDANRAAVGPNPNHLEPKAKIDIPLLSSFTPAQLLDARRRHPSWKSFPHSPAVHRHGGAAKPRTKGSK
jgi:hypothetical protein